MSQNFSVCHLKPSLVVKVLCELPNKPNQHFVFFGYKISIQQNCKSHLFWKTKSNSRWFFWILMGWQICSIVIHEALSPLNSVLGGMLQSSISCFKKTSQWILMFSSKQLFSPRTGHCMITSLGLKRGVIVVQKIRFLWGVRAFFFREES